MEGSIMTITADTHRLIPLTQGQFAKVDADDFELLSQFKWFACWNKYTQSFYASRAIHIEGKRGTLGMHRMILNLHTGDKRQGDHINHDTLDNRRINLRVAAQSENMRNREKYSNNTSGFKGVSFRKQRGNWRAQIKINGHKKHLGTRNSPEEAFELYKEASKKYHGEFGRAS
jgi:hypothetical protein